MNIRINRISIIGDGGWGTTLAVHLAKKGLPVCLWGAFTDNIAAIKKDRVNQKFLPGVLLPLNVQATADLELAVNNGELIVLAVPSQYLTEVLKKIRQFPLDNKVFLSVIKGLDTKSLLRMSQIIHRELGPVHLAVLSGPNIAAEVARGIPSTAVIASSNGRLAKTLQEIFNSDYFRVYRNTDIVGVELGGSLKNVIALACGVCDGLGFGANTKAAILTRGLVEMARLGKAMGGKTQTFSGLAGLGDMVTTCNSSQSRNRYVGEQLGQGKTWAEIIPAMNNRVAEGVETVKAVMKLSRKFKIPMPIATEVYNIIYKNKPAHTAVAALMHRKTKAE
jgi:glycerol-3-phosphate dehydrogenase (NAD(P)+)